MPEPEDQAQAQQPEVSDLELSELENILDGVDGPTEDPRSEEEPPEEAAQEAEAPEAEEQAAEPSDDAPEPEEEPLTRDQLRDLQMKAKDDEIEHQKRIASRHGGELGFLRKKVQELESRLSQGGQAQQPAQGDTSLELGYEPEPPPQQPAPPEPASANSVTAYVVGQAIAAGGQQVLAKNQDLLAENGQFPEDLQQELSKVNTDHLFMLDDPVEAARLTQQYTEEAIASVRRLRRQAEVASAEQRFTDQAQRHKDKKRAAVISTSSTPETAAKPLPSSPTKWSKKQLDAAIDEMEG